MDAIGLERLRLKRDWLKYIYFSMLDAGMEGKECEEVEKEYSEACLEHHFWSLHLNPPRVKYEDPGYSGEIEVTSSWAHGR